MIVRKIGATERLKEKQADYENFEQQAKSWFESNLDKLNALIDQPWLRDFIFEPVKGVFEVPGSNKEQKVYTVITLVAIVNMVLAGLPGKMGVGVFVSIGLELWMAWVIARCAGLELSTEDLWKHVVTAGGALISAVVIFQQILSLAYSAFSIVPGINPLIFAELLTTNMIGIALWFGFLKLYEKDKFSLSWLDLSRVGKDAWMLFKFQGSMVRKTLSISNLKLMGSRIKSFLNGDISIDKPSLRGEILTAACMGYLISGSYESLHGPVGQEFIGAIKDRMPELQSASIEQIAEHMRDYEPAQLLGIENLIKGKLFERLTAQHENTDSDLWQAAMHDDESYPGSDIILTNTDTGETIELSLKATFSQAYVEQSLLRYPDVQIMTTSEVAGRFVDDERVVAGEFSNEYLQTVTQENFDALLNALSAQDVILGAGTGVAAGSLISLWPFVVARMRGRISEDQLKQACVALLGDAGKQLGSRLAWAATLGPLYAWIVLARATMSGVRAAHSVPDVPSRRLVYVPNYATEPTMV